MPGVPSGRGCDGCRRQKKKCDQAQPRCSRCERLNLTCVGAGVQRYKFKSHNGSQLVLAGNSTRHKSTSRSKSPSPSHASSRSRTESVTPGPSNMMFDRLLSEVIYITNLSTSLRYNFVYAYGGFLLLVPQHLGLNEALDASAEAVISAYSNFCRGIKGPAPDTLALYSRGLKALHACLDDPAKACATETLCAIMLLLICQSYIGTQGCLWTVHCEGAAQILKARGNSPPRCQLEHVLLLSLRGPVVFEALINDRIQMDPTEWEFLVQDGLNDGSLEGQFMHSLSKAPDFIRRGRDVLSERTYDPTLLTEIDIQYKRMKYIVIALEQRLATVQVPGPNDELDLTKKNYMHGVYQRGYALGLFVAIIMNCLTTALSPHDAIHELNLESAHYVREIIDVAHNSHMYRPLGAAYVIICLLAAFAGAVDEATRLEIIDLMEDYHQDFGWVVESRMFHQLRSVTGKMLICEPESAPGVVLKLKDLFATCS